MKLGKALATGVAQEQPESYEEETPLAEESPFAEESPEPVAREEAPAAAR
ncbi:hypothetical protein [Streptomyces sp. NPDC000134]